MNRYRIGENGARVFYSDLRPRRELAGQVVTVSRDNYAAGPFASAVSWHKSFGGAVGAGDKAVLAHREDGGTCWIFPDEVEAAR